MQGSPDFLNILFLIMERGLWLTLLLTVSALLIGCVAGISLALLRVYGPKELQWIPTVYERIFRSIPLLVLLFIFGAALLSYFMWAGSTGSALLVAAIFALALRSAAYQSEIFRGAIMSVDLGQMMAAQSVGMNNMQATLHIVLPQALRLSLPGWANEYAVVIKDSSLCSAIGIYELLYITESFELTFPAYFLPIILMVAIVYFVFTYPVTKYIGESMTSRLRRFGLGGGR